MRKTQFKVCFLVAFPVLIPPLLLGNGTGLKKDTIIYAISEDSHFQEDSKNLVVSILQLQKDSRNRGAEECMRITNSHAFLARNIVVFGKKVSWDTSAVNPHVRFAFRVLNANPVSVRFSGRTVLEAKRPEGPDHIMNVFPVDGESFDVLVAPGRIEKIEGMFKWPATKAHAPGILFPGQSKSIYTVSSAEGPAPGAPPIDSTNFNLEPRKDGPTEEEVFSLISFLNKEKHSLHQYTKGVGSSLNDDDEINTTQWSASYEPVFRTSTDLYQKFLVNKAKNEIRYSADLFSGVGKKKAYDRFNKIKKMISDRLPGFVLEQSTGVSRTAAWKNESGVRTFSFELQKEENVKNSYLLSFDFYGSL